MNGSNLKVCNGVFNLQIREDLYFFGRNLEKKGWGVFMRNLKLAA